MSMVVMSGCGLLICCGGLVQGAREESGAHWIVVFKVCHYGVVEWWEDGCEGVRRWFGGVCFDTAQSSIEAEAVCCAPRLVVCRDWIAWPARIEAPERFGGRRSAVDCVFVIVLTRLCGCV